MLAGKNAEAEKLVNQTFTCTGGGSRGGARGPWGCYQELGSLHIVWSSDIESVPLNEWKYTMIETPGIKDHRKQWQETRRLVAKAVKVETDDTDWTDYVLAGGFVPPDLTSEFAGLSATLIEEISPLFDGAETITRGRRSSEVNRRRPTQARAAP